MTSNRGELTSAERIEYTDAVLCMQKQPQQLPREEFPGVRNRFDDFVAYVSPCLYYPLRTDMSYLVLISTTHLTSITAVCFCRGTDTSSGSGRQLSKMNADTMANFR
jgi:hypothetical protein